MTTKQKTAPSLYLSPEIYKIIDNPNLLPAPEKAKQKPNKEWHRNYYREKRKNQSYKLYDNLLSLFNQTLHGKTLKSPTMEKFGYTPDELREHIENQFEPRMTWENYGSYWCLDHIIPASWFNYQSYDDPECKACWRLDNLRPLEKIKNTERAIHHGRSQNERVKSELQTLQKGLVSAVLASLR